VQSRPSFPSDAVFARGLGPPAWRCIFEAFSLFSGSESFWSLSCAWEIDRRKSSALRIWPFFFMVPATPYPTSPSYVLSFEPPPSPRAIGFSGWICRFFSSASMGSQAVVLCSKFGLARSAAWGGIVLGFRCFEWP